MYLTNVWTLDEFFFPYSRKFITIITHKKVIHLCAYNPATVREHASSPALSGTYIARVLNENFKIETGSLYQVAAIKGKTAEDK